MSTTAARASILAQWLGEGRSVVAGLLFDTDGSSPLDPGAMMLIDGEGNVEGTVTGGCVEAAVVAEAEELLARPERTARVVSYGVSDDAAGAVGLTCGGTVHILVHEISEASAGAELAAARAVVEGRPAVVATVLDGERVGAQMSFVDEVVTGSLDGGALLDQAVSRDARGLVESGRSTVRRYGLDGSTLGAELRVFFRVHAPRPQMLLIGAIDFSAALAPMASQLGYLVTICDARETFVRSPRFSGSAEVVRQWPDRLIASRSLGPRDVVLVLTHDPKFDEPALLAAVRSGAGYVGALGSRRTVADRHERLRRAGLDDGQLDRIFSPCGLDLGARGPEETAVSILAEIITQRTGRSGGHLRDARSHIHVRDVADIGDQGGPDRASALVGREEA